MKILKRVLIVLGVLIAILLLAALFISKEYHLERTITINKPRADVFNYVKFLKNQDHYNKWVRTDPGMKKEFRGVDGTPGFVYAWDSKNDNAGKGEEEIKSIKEGERIDVEVRFEKPFEGIAQTPIITEDAGGGATKVTMGMTGKTAYPMNVMNLFMDGMLGEDMEASLAMLKDVLEKQ